MVWVFHMCIAEDLGYLGVHVGNVTDNFGLAGGIMDSLTRLAGLIKGHFRLTVGF